MKYTVKNKEEIKQIDAVIKKNHIDTEKCFESVEIIINELIRFTHFKTFKDDAKILIRKTWGIYYLRYKADESELTLSFKDFITVFPGIKSYSIQVVDDEGKEKE